MNCKKCGVFNVEGARFCRGCGSQIDADDLTYDVKAKTEELYCPKCGSANNSNYIFCKKCECSVESDFDSMKAQNANVLIEQNITIRRILCVMLLLAAILSLLTSVYYGLGFREVLSTTTAYQERNYIGLYTVNTWGVADYIESKSSSEMKYQFGDVKDEVSDMVAMSKSVQIHFTLCYGALSILLAIAIFKLHRKNEGAMKLLVTFVIIGLGLVLLDVLIGYFALDLCREYERSMYWGESYETHDRVIPQRTVLLLLPILMLTLVAGIKSKNQYLICSYRRDKNG